jgi:hypothetical protein
MQRPFCNFNTWGDIGWEAINLFERERLEFSDPTSHEQI